MSTVRICSALLSPIDLKHRLERDQAIVDAQLQLEVVEDRPRYRGIEPTVLVAIIGAAGSALGALVSGLVQIAHESHSSTIVVQGKDGRRVEFPTDTRPERIKQLIDVMGEMESPTVRLT